MKHLSAENFNVDLNSPRAKIYSPLLLEEENEKNNYSTKISRKSQENYDNLYITPILIFHQLKTLGFIF